MTDNQPSFSSILDGLLFCYGVDPKYSNTLKDTALKEILALFTQALNYLEQRMPEREEDAVNSKTMPFDGVIGYNTALGQVKEQFKTFREELGL